MQQCAIYALAEMKKKLTMDKKELAVLARYRGKLILIRDLHRALWTLPSGRKEKGDKTPENAVRRIVSAALGESTFDVALLCGYGVTGEDGKERGGYCYLADVRSWAEDRGKACAFEHLPVAEQLADPALVVGLKRWAGDFFDETLDIDRLGEIASL